MKLSLSFDDEESEGITFNNFEDSHIERGFFDKLPKEFEKIIGEIKKKSKGKDCPKLKSNTSGAFGDVQITSSKVLKLLDLIQNDKHNILLTGHSKGRKGTDLYFLMNRLNNYCNDIKYFIKSSKKYFPNNFLEVFKCNLCNKEGKKIPSVYVEMEVGKGLTMKDFLKKSTTSKKDMYSVIIQTYYISLVLNMNKLYHNDLKGANIIISKSTKDIIYDSLKNKKGEKITMKLPKGNYYPILIDYDLVTKGESRPAEVEAFLSQGSPDYDFFIASTEKFVKPLSKMLNDLPSFDDTKELKESFVDIHKAMKKYNKVMKISSTQKGGNPLLALKAASFLKNPAVRKMAMNVVRNPQLQQMALQQGQQYLQQNPQIQRQLNQRFQQMQQPQFQQMMPQMIPRQYQQMMPQQFRGGKNQKGGDDLSKFLSAGIENLSLNNNEIDNLMKDIKKMKITTRKKAMTSFEKILAARGKKSQQRKQNGGAKKKRKSKK